MWLPVLLSVVLAVVASGAVLGFIFALPRNMEIARQRVEEKTEISTESANPGASGRGTSEATIKESQNRENISRRDASGWSNNNLIEVSDWLTKIFVGLGLVQFNQIIAWVGTTGPKIGSALGLAANKATAIGASILVAGFLLGFLVMYIFTRTQLAELMARSTSTVENELALTRVAKQVNDLKNSNDLNERIFAGVTRSLIGGEGDLSQAIRYLYLPPPESYTKALPELDKIIESGNGTGYIYALKSSA